MVLCMCTHTHVQVRCCSSMVLKQSQIPCCGKLKWLFLTLFLKQYLFSLEFLRAIFSYNNTKLQSYWGKQDKFSNGQSFCLIWSTISKFAVIRECRSNIIGNIFSYYSRRKHLFSRDRLKLFLKQHCEQHDGVIKTKVNKRVKLFCGMGGERENTDLEILN